MPPPTADYLVSYDIANRKRWRRVFRLLQGYGEWVQLSVFRCRLDRGRHARMVAELRRSIDHHEDRLLIAQLVEDEATVCAKEKEEPRPYGRALVL